MSSTVCEIEAIKKISIIFTFQEKRISLTCTFHKKKPCKLQMLIKCLDFFKNICNKVKAFFYITFRKLNYKTFFPSTDSYLFNFLH